MATKNKGKPTTAPVGEVQEPQEGAAPVEEVQEPQEGAAPVEEVQEPQEGTTPLDDGEDPQDPSAIPEDTVVVNFPSGLNLRDGPGLSFHVLGQAPDGVPLTVLQLPGGAEVPGFALVRYEGGEDGPLVGWVNTNFVRED